MENIRKPQILIQTDGITNTKILIDGKELPGVAGVRFSQSYKENKGLPVLQIDLKATNVTLDGICRVLKPGEGCSCGRRKE